MVTKVNQLLSSYMRYVQLLGSDEEALEAEALAVLTLRDALEERWEELSEEQRMEVSAGDSLLAKKHGAVAVVLPSAHAHDRRHWWWFLHEGPQVRDKAEVA